MARLTVTPVLPLAASAASMVSLPSLASVLPSTSPANVTLVDVAAVIAGPAPVAPTQKDPMRRTSAAMRSRTARAVFWASSRETERV